MLGLIAGLTVPSIVASVDRSRNRSILKEAFQTVSAITQEGVLNGDFQNITGWYIESQNGAGSIVNYISSKLNYSKQCLTTDITSDGCKRGWAGQPASSTYNAHNARWILPNGAKIQASHFWNAWNSSSMAWTITTKAFADDMVVSGANRDTIQIVCNVADVIQQPYSWVDLILKPGACGLLDTSYQL